MERAGDAMKQIHGKLNIDKVDETMYVLLCIQNTESTVLIFPLPGRNSGNSMLWAKKLLKPSQVRLLASLSTRLSWMMNWRN